MLYMAHPPISTSLQFCCLAIVLLDNVKVKSGALFRYSKNYVRAKICVRTRVLRHRRHAFGFVFVFRLFPPPQPPNGPGGR